MRTLLRGGLATGLLALAAVAAPAGATPFEATLSFSFDSAIGTLGAISFQGSGSGASVGTGSRLISVPSGLFAGAASVPVAGVASVSGISLLVSGNGAGQLGKLKGAAVVSGQLPVSGALRVKGSLGGGAATLVSVPLQFTKHYFGSNAFLFGLGRGGDFASPSANVEFHAWGTPGGTVSVPWGMYTYLYHISYGSQVSVTVSYHYTATRGSDARTPGGLGQVTLVSPMRVRTRLPGTGTLLVVFSRLTLNFVPEPGTLALLGMGVAGLCFVGRGRLRRRI